MKYFNFFTSYKRWILSTNTNVTTIKGENRLPIRTVFGIASRRQE